MRQVNFRLKGNKYFYCRISANFDFPTVPLKLMNTQYMTKKEKDEQENGKKKDVCVSFKKADKQ